MPKHRLTYSLSAPILGYLYQTSPPIQDSFYIEGGNWQIFTVQASIFFQVPQPVSFMKLPGLEAILSENNGTAAR